MPKEPRWRCAGGRRRDIVWPTRGEDANGRYAPPLNRAKALKLVTALAVGTDIPAIADTFGSKSFSVTYSKTPFDHRGRRSKAPIWTMHMFVDLNPCDDADRFRGPLDGLPPDAFKGF